MSRVIAMSSAGNPRLLRLAAEARKQREAWLDQGWQDGPHVISKEEILNVIRHLQTLHAEERQAGLCKLQALASLAARADVALKDLALPALSGAHWPVSIREELATELVAVDSYKEAQFTVRRHLHEARADSRAVIQPYLKSLVRPQNEQERLKDPSWIFLQKLREPASADVCDLLRKFIKSIEISWDVKQMYAAVRDDDERDYNDGGPENNARGAATSPVVGPPPFTGTLAAFAGAQHLQGLGPSEATRSFLVHIEERKIKGHPTWRDVQPSAASSASASLASMGADGGASADAWEATVCAGLEKFVFTRTYSSLFARHPKSASRDARLAARLHSLQFLGFQHLDLPKDMPSWLMPVWHLAEESLRSMSSYRAPSDKVACIMNASRILSTLLTFYYTEVKAANNNKGQAGNKGSSSSSSGGVGADDFLPALIYSILQARPDQLYSNLRYLGDFTRPSVLMSQAGYFLTSVFSAVSFLRQARPEQLSLTREAFEEGIERATEEGTVKNATQMNRALEVARRTRGASMALGFPGAGQQKQERADGGDGLMGEALPALTEEGEDEEPSGAALLDDTSLLLSNLDVSGVVADADAAANGFGRGILGSRHHGDEEGIAADGFSSDGEDESRGFGEEEDDEDDYGDGGAAGDGTRQNSESRSQGRPSTGSDGRLGSSAQHLKGHNGRASVSTGTARPEQETVEKLKKRSSKKGPLPTAGSGSQRRVSGGLLSAVAAEINQEDSAALDGLLRPPTAPQESGGDRLHQHQASKRSQLLSAPSSASLLSRASGHSNTRASDGRAAHYSFLSIDGGVAGRHSESGADPSVSAAEFRAMVAKLKLEGASTSAGSSAAEAFEADVHELRLKTCNVPEGLTGSAPAMVAQAHSLLQRYQRALEKSKILFDLLTPTAFASAAVGTAGEAGGVVSGDDIEGQTFVALNIAWE